MGVEYITQPQVFLAPISAVNGIQGVNEAYPLLTTYQAWTSTAAINATVFPIPGNWVMIDEPGSFIVTVGGVVQPPAEYTVNRTLRTLTFSAPVSADVEVSVRQLATAAPSSQDFDFVKAISATFTGTATINNLSGVTGRFNDLTTTKLFVTNLTALSSVLNVVDITQIELSGFNISGGLSATSANINTVNSTNITLANTGSLIGTTSATSISIGTLSAREIDLVHTPANDGVDPILDIGETTTDGFSGIRIRYEENSNRLLVQTIAPSLTSNSVIIDRATGRVGVSAVPNEALTVQGNISATGAIKAVNTWPNRQISVLSADGSTIAANNTISVFTELPTLQANLIYNIASYVLLSGNSATPNVGIALSGNAPFSILEGVAWGDTTLTDTGNPYLASNLGRIFNTGPATSFIILPNKTYSGANNGFNINPVISAAQTFQLQVSCVANTPTRAKSKSNYFASIIQSV